MRLIPLTQGKFALVDDEDFEFINQFRWSAEKNRGKKTWYARTNSKTAKGKRETCLRMHRLILKLEKGDKKIVDHRDGNGLNNQRTNLRLASTFQSMANRGIRKDSKSGFKGVSLIANGKWQAE